MNIGSLSDEELEQKTIDHWADYFDSSPEKLEERGSTFLKRENASENLVVIAHVGNRTFVQYDPNSEDRILAFAKVCPGDLIVSADHLVSYFGNDQIQIDCLDNLMYLSPAKFRTSTHDSEYVIRKLGADDKRYLAELNDSCTREEVDNTFLDIDELGAWGCFFDDRLVAAISYADWDLFGDFGVLTHPEFRRRGLAKAVLAAGCKEAIEIGRIPIYRCHITLFPSINTARAVGFSHYPRTYFKQEVLLFANPKH